MQQKQIIKKDKKMNLKLQRRPLLQQRQLLTFIANKLTMIEGKMAPPVRGTTPSKAGSGAGGVNRGPAEWTSQLNGKTRPPLQRLRRHHTTHADKR